jgi:hypothetical protein
MPDPVDADSIAESAAAPASASVNGESASAHSISEQIKAAEYKAQQDALDSGTNEQGGKKSGWRGLRAARPIFPAHTN